MTGLPVIDQQNFLTDWPVKPISTSQENTRLNTPFWDYKCDIWTILSIFEYSYSLLMYLPFILTAMILHMMKFLSLVGRDLISRSLGRIYLTGHMAGQPVNSVNWLVKPRSSQCCQYLTLTEITMRQDRWDSKMSFAHSAGTKLLQEDKSTQGLLM